MGSQEDDVLSPKAASTSPLDALSYYRATANAYAPFPSLECTIEVDVAVVGAGFTGLSAALELRLRGYSVAVIEQGPIGWGASGRNGGQICTGFPRGFGKLEQALGFEAAKACFLVSEEAKVLIAERVERYGIACDLTWALLTCAPKASHVEDLRREQEELARYGYPRTTLLSKTELEARLATTIYHGALEDHGAGHFHPLNYAIGLAETVRKHGGEVFENTTAREVRQGARPAVICERGEVRAGSVILACDAYLEGLAPRQASRAMPVGSYVIATEPLGAARARGLIRDNHAVSDTNFVLDYFRLSADHRLLFGGRASYFGIHPKDLAANMRPRMLRVFPQLAGVRIDYAWGGQIGITYNRLPDAGRIGSNIYYVQGFSGQGVALSGMFGKLMAEAVAGESERFDLFGKIKHAPFPGGPFRRPALALGMLYYRLRDILG
jgi:gamma-glutamylputrescine oxidase